MNQNEIFKKEAGLFGTYLLKKNPDESSIVLYVSAMNILPFPLSKKEERILNFIYKNHWSIPFIDSGLALISPKSLVRKKIFTMLAILESSPVYSRLFLPRGFSPFYPLYIFFTLVKAGFKALAGAILITAI